MILLPNLYYALHVHTIQNMTKLPIIITHIKDLLNYRISYSHYKKHDQTPTHYTTHIT